MPTKKDPAKRKYGTFEKRIAKELALLPDETLLALAQTKKQVEYWFRLRTFRVCLSLCWKALHEGDDDPIHALLKAGQIDQFTYERAWLTVDLYERLWELVQISFRYIRPELTRLGMGEHPDSAFELFGWIVSHDANSAFLKCLEPYYEFSSRKKANEYRLLEKDFKGEANPIEQNQAQRLKSDSNGAIEIVLAVCAKKATRSRPALKARLEAFYTALFKLGDYNAKHCWHAGSYAWNKGDLMHGSDGVYKFLNKT